MADVDWSMHKLVEPEPRARYLTREEADSILYDNTTLAVARLNLQIVRFA